MVLRKIKPMLLILLAALLIAFSCVCASAADASDVNLQKRGLIRLTLCDKDNNYVSIPDDTFTVFKVGSVERMADGSLKHEYMPDFTSAGASLEDISAEGLADHLFAYAVYFGVDGIEQKFGEDEAVYFKDLDVGLYLVAQTGNIDGYFQTTPFLVSIPVIAYDGSIWMYNIDATPKTQMTPNPELFDTTFAVQKVWKNDGAAIADSLSIQLLEDGKVVDTVTLSAENGWKYKWAGLSNAHRYSVFETQVPDGYVVSYNTEGDLTTITNTYEPPADYPGEPNEPTTPDEPKEPVSLSVKKEWDGNGDHPDSIKVSLYRNDIAIDTVTLSAENDWMHKWSDLDGNYFWQVREVNIPKGYVASYSVNGDLTVITNSAKLIQTGQLNWPVPLLAVGGLVIFAIGWALVFFKRKKKDAKNA